MKKLLCVLAVSSAIAIPISARAYGPQGHSMVGAIADHLLKSKPVSAKINTMLDGLTLAQAALIADEIKSWDSEPPVPGKTFLKHHPDIEKQMIAFHAANHEHRSFHFTDVPVVGGERYADGTVGRSDHDLVQMITFCIKVLTEEEPEANNRKITKPVAVILLAHYLGDEHQPLHVGAEYFDASAQPVNPDTTPGAQKDTGGNDIVLSLEGLNDEGHGHGDHNPSLHSFWDDAAVLLAMQSKRESLQNGHAHLTDDDIAQSFAASKPDGLDHDATTDLHRLSESWANEILPIAKDAHDRLTFAKVKVESHDEALAAKASKHAPKWIAIEKSPGTYGDFAAETVTIEIPKAGWRLASLLERIVQ